MTVEWIAVDWGTSNLRVWGMDTVDRVVVELSSDQGMNTLTPEMFEAELLKLIAPHLSAPLTPVICCGMAGSRQGWSEAPYKTAPCTPPGGLEAHRVANTDPRIAVFILPGVKQMSPPDVMRGEETQISGFLRKFPDFDGVLCLPGTHTKWVQISAGEIVSFRTCMTGELFALLSEASVLRHSVQSTAFDQDAFETAVRDGISNPADLATQLFRLRAASLILDMGPALARTRLSGLLIGSELAATKPYWLGQQVAIIGTSTLSDRYCAALTAQGLAPQQADAIEMALQGLAAAQSVIKEKT